MSVKTGIPGPWLQPSEYGRNEVGQFATVPYEDVDPNKINNLAAQFDRLGYRYRVIHSFGKHRLEVYLSYNPETKDEQPVDLWEYTSLTAQKSLLAANVVSGITQLLIAENVKIIKDALNGTMPNGFVSSPGHTDLQPSDFTGNINQQNAAWDVYTLMHNDFETVEVGAPTIRHTQTVSFIYPITLSKENVGRVITTPTLISMENPPDWAVNGLPDDPAPTIGGIVLAYGWMKKPPAIQQIAGQKVQLVQEFQYGLWPLIIYGVNGKFL
jgi:hypothetical protein